MDEITFEVSRDEESGWLVACWDAPDGSGGITTQGEDLRDLQAQIVDAVATHFEEAPFSAGVAPLAKPHGETPGRIRLHFINDPILITA